MRERRVDFFIAGVQKGGTTALDAMLRGHPRVQMANLKEVHFFDNDSVDWNTPDLALLHNQFDWNAANVVRGEATPIYTYWRKALPRLRDYNPDARIIVGLRHPTFRAYSHWRMEVTRNAETLDFLTAISSGRSRVSDAPDMQHRVFSYIERGFYEQQITALQELFPSSQLHFFRTDSLWENPSIELARIERFLGIERVVKPRQSYVVPLHSAPADHMTKSVRDYLDEVFRPTISALSDLTGLIFEDWKTPDYAEPMAPRE